MADLRRAIADDAVAPLPLTVNIACNTKKSGMQTSSDIMDEMLNVDQYNISLWGLLLAQVQSFLNHAADA